jgi:hypothetical protein
MSEPPDSFPSFTSGTSVEVNDKTARPRSGNTARSLRSLRSEGRATPCAHTHALPYPTSQNEVNEVNKKGYPRRRVAKTLFTSTAPPEVNEVNEVPPLV